MNILWIFSYTNHVQRLRIEVRLVSVVGRHFLERRNEMAEPVDNVGITLSNIYKHDLTYLFKVE